MSFLNKLSKNVGKAAEQAKFEADKALRVRRISGEVGAIENNINGAILAAGRKAVELRIPGLEEVYAQIDEFNAQLEAKKVELEAARAEQWVDTAPVDTTLGGGKFCPNCGNSVTPGTKFCPGCGAKIN